MLHVPPAPTPLLAVGRLEAAVAAGRLGDTVTAAGEGVTTTAGALAAALLGTAVADGVAEAVGVEDGVVEGVPAGDVVAVVAAAGLLLDAGAGVPPDEAQPAIARTAKTAIAPEASPRIRTPAQ
ncbi:hypothetical protein [Kitasatospora indigofera]|uniref:hypothetical protein n=1 Tax=Kitasatospora indigofera TaxID=67307 RepID=UPI0033AF45AE